MNIFSHFKKIFNSYDFMGNRIKRLRVDTPKDLYDSEHTQDANPQYRTNLKGQTPDEISKEIYDGLKGPGTTYNENDYQWFKDFVANKDYVDQRTNYHSEVAKNQEGITAGVAETSENIAPTNLDTIKGRQYDAQKKDRTSTVFPWLPAVYGLPHDELLDALIYPRIPYTYIYPKITNIEIRTNELLVETLEQHTKTNKFSVLIGVENSIKFDIQIDNGDWINANTAKIVFIRSNGVELTINGTAGPTNPVFNGTVTYASDIVRVEFRQTYNSYVQHYDTWGYPTYPNPQVHNMVVDITEEFFKQCYVWGLKIAASENQALVYSKNKLNSTLVQTNGEYRYLQVENPLDSDYYLECLIYKESNDQLLNSTHINQEEIQPDGKITYNFGVFPFNTYIKFRPVPVTTDSNFTQRIS